MTETQSRKRPLRFCRTALAVAQLFTVASAFVSTTQPFGLQQPIIASTTTSFLPYRRDAPVIIETTNWATSCEGATAPNDCALQSLQRAMRAQYFTETEILQLINVMNKASHGDTQLQSGAASFLLILLNVDMGLQALLAAAVHYCDCDATIVDAHAQWIAKDAARLRQLELLAVTSTAGPDAVNADNLRKLLLSETRDWRALAIRVAACLFRLQTNDKQYNAELMRVAREALHIYAPLASRLGMHRLKNELEGAAFQLLYKRQHAAIMSQMDATDSMETVLSRVQTEMTVMFDKDEEFQTLVHDFQVTARVKEPYSLWKKMLKQGYKHILQVPDALALRIVLNAKKLTGEPSEVTRARERALCYYAQKLCTQRWSPMHDNPRFKDYIDSPKANGYQSLHYTAETECAGKEWTLEIQVRSGEMHQVAEFGLACHWDYKAQQSSQQAADNVDHSSEAYLRKVQEWHWEQSAGAAQDYSSQFNFEPDLLNDLWQSKDRADRIRARTERFEPYIQALTAAKSDLTRDYVFVFVTECATRSNGQVLALPSGACVIDALRKGATGRPYKEEELALNGYSTTMTRQLSNGDMLILPKSQCPVPV
jgi:(p)ppGpp synthase/HD superfamily hydrolase